MIGLTDRMEDVMLLESSICPSLSKDLELVCIASLYEMYLLVVDGRV